MQRCLVQWVSGGKKPSGHPADRGMACCPDACCSRTRNKESFWRPWPPLSPWILDRSSPPFHRSPVPCRAPFVRALGPALALPRSREKFTYGGEDRDRESIAYTLAPPSINRTLNVSPKYFSIPLRKPKIHLDSVGKVKFFGFCICVNLNIKERGEDVNVQIQCICLFWIYTKKID